MSENKEVDLYAGQNTITKCFWYNVLMGNNYNLTQQLRNFIAHF